LFRLQTDGTFTKLHDFNGADGSGPLEMTLGREGALYGPTASGTLFRLQTNGAFSNLYNFSVTEGNMPLGPLAVGPDGALYGLTPYGGTNAGGIRYRVQSNGTFTKLHDFSFSNTSAEPPVGMVVGPDGALYGSTRYGGTNGYGTLFRFDTNLGFKGLHDFNLTDGANPRAQLVAGPDGALYGSTFNGGLGYGTLFRLDTNGNFNSLHDFNLTDGAYSAAELVAGPDGALYGSTSQGGSYFGGSAYYGYGTLFRLATNGTFAKVHDFNGTNGASPGALVVGPDGALFGSTYGGGSYGDGTLFRVETNGAFTKLHDFNLTEGISPNAPLVVGPDRALYGSTYSGGRGTYSYYGYGTLFRLQTDGTFTKPHDFTGTNGARPMEAPVVGPDGALYGATPYGGPRRGGILFKLLLSHSPVPRSHNVTVTAAANCVADASVDDGSFDPDAGDTITIRQDPPGPYALGTTPVTLTVTDNHGATASSTATVTVVDATPPTLGDVTVTPNVLWPPNDKMVEVTLNYAATDKCGTISNTLSVTSNEANGTAPDWVIEHSHHVQLRAERSNTGAGRVYMITVISTDNSGNASTRTVTVTAPRNQN
jgi:uncharacterized repeat protein (TIGR03803 family)